MLHQPLEGSLEGGTVLFFPLCVYVKGKYSFVAAPGRQQKQPLFFSLPREKKMVFVAALGRQPGRRD